MAGRRGVRDGIEFEMLLGMAESQAEAVKATLPHGTVTVKVVKGGFAGDCQRVNLVVDARVGDLPQTGVWTRLSVPMARAGLAMISAASRQAGWNVRQSARG